MSHPVIALAAALATLAAALLAVTWIVKMLRRLYSRLGRTPEPTEVGGAR